MLELYYNLFISTENNLNLFEIIGIISFIYKAESFFNKTLSINQQVLSRPQRLIIETLKEELY
jgi:hypothetical protein